MIYYIVIYQGVKISCKYVIEAKACGSFNAIRLVSEGLGSNEENHHCKYKFEFFLISI